MTEDLKIKKTIENYWLKRLSGDLPKISLPLLKESSAGDSAQKATIQVPLPEPACRRLLEISGDSDIALFILFFSGLNLAFTKYTGSDDLLIGTVPPRQEGVKDKLILCRNKLAGNVTFKETLNRMKQTVLEDFNYATPGEETYSFGFIYQKLLERSGKEMLEVFNAACLYDKLQNKSKLLKQFQLVFLLSRQEERLVLEADYNTTLYSEGIVERFCRNLVNIFEHLDELLNLEIAEIDILCEQELQELMNFNKTGAEYPENKTIHQLFEEQAARTPDLTAVVFEGNGTTYRELNEKANRLAHLLREKGVGPGTIVAVMMERSLDLAAGLLGILKAGGAYLPIDPQVPKNRLITMLSDSRAAFLLTWDHLATRYSYTALQGLREKKAAPFYTPQRKQLADLDTLPIPNRSLVNYEKYSRYIGQVMVKNIISLQTARGCPYDCSYCSKIWSRKHVFRSAEDILKEMKIYYDMGFRRFSIFDDIFNVNAANGMRFFEMIIKNRLDVQLFFPNGLRGDLLTKDYIDLLVEAGLASTALALETASPRLQKMINKNLNLEKFSENVKYFCEKHPHVILELFTIHGFPTETEEEARLTMDFIKQQRWLHFPYVFILKIYPDTEMADLAMRHGVPREDILKCEDLAFHELSPTSPFKKSFTKNYQAEFLNEYFLLKERLLHVLPFQAKALTRDEIIQKYNSYLPYNIERFEDILELAGIKEEELGQLEFREEVDFEVPQLNRKLREHFPVHKPAENALRILFLDLTQYFSRETDMLYDVVEPPLGAMYIMTYLEEQLGEKMAGQILKSRIDFDSYDELKARLEEFRPDVIGVRSLTFYRDFYHKTISLLRLWGFGGPIIAGGPYATRNTETLLQDRNIDLAVISEGEATFLEIIKKITANSGKLPGEADLKEISGIAFVPRGRDVSGAREILLLDGDLMDDALSQESTANPAPVNGSSDMAYIIYTSGSTGTPKGVIAEHRNAVNVLNWFGSAYNLNPESRVIQLTNYTFDPSVEQIFGTLLRGGAVYLAPRELAADREVFARFIRENRVQVVNFVPGTLKELLGYQDRLESLGVVISGGEKLDNAIKNQLLEKGYNLYNHYGPTETTIDALMKKCSLGEDVTLGSPIANTQCHILDINLKPVPVGVTGELYIGGAGVARGYLNRPELTAEKFKKIYRSYGSYETYIFYRTGDLARWLPAGEIDFLGRIDQQVKIRGFRVELGEIESQILKYPGIKRVVVSGRQSEDGETRLCAYFIAENDTDPEKIPAGTELRERLSVELPDYMVPANFVVLKEIPLTPNGKIDYNALPSPEAGTAEAEYEPPANEMEEILLEIWVDVLAVKKEKVGVKANFFEIGGDSIKVIQISARLRKYGLKVESGDIFTYPTIKQLAGRVTRAERVIDQSAVEGEVMLTPVQVWFFQENILSRNLYNQDVMLFSKDGFDPGAVRAVFTAIQEHHDALRMTYKEVDGKVIQVNHGLAYPFSLEVYDFCGQPMSGAAGLLNKKTADIKASLDLETGPLMKLGLFHLDDGDRLFIVIHHLVIDGISWRILFEDVETLFQQHKSGKSPELPLKTDSFKYWAEQLSQYAGSEEFLMEKDYWGQLELADVPPLPRDFDGENYTRDAKFASFRLSMEETEKLLTKVNEAFGTEINDILLTALGLAIKKAFLLPRLALAMEGHGRESILKDVNINRTIGWFTSLYPVLLEFPGQDDYSLYIKETKERLRQVPNKGIGHGILKYLTPEDQKQGIRLRLTPEIAFNYLGQFDLNLENRSFTVIDESTMDWLASEEKREYPLEVAGMIINRQLALSVTYSNKQYKTETIERLWDYYREELSAIIDYCSSRDEKEMTPSDFTYDKLSVEAITSLDEMFNN